MPREFRLSVRVYYEDTDAAGIVYHANHLRFMERARTEWLRALGFDQVALARALGLAFVMRDAAIDWLRPARFDDLLEVVSRVTRCGRASLEFAQELVRTPGDELICRARVRVGCVDLRRMVPTRMPDDIYARIRDAC
jgi:acyl-CoA thioester hydrolase